MKSSIAWGIVSGLLCVLVCWNYLRSQPRENSDPSVEMEVQFEQSSPEEQTSFDNRTIIPVEMDGETVEMTLHDYLIGVLTAEVPASFAEEALKAQAVAARTFTLKQIETGKHDGAVCTRSSCCQAWKSPEEGTVMEQAVTQTDGYVITYEGALIDAVFFSCSGGRTEAAVAVWGGEVPYLQSVPSPGEEEAAPFSDTVVLSAQDFAQTLSALAPEADLTGLPETWFGDVTYTQGGGVDTIVIGGTVLTGLQLRSAFSLRSTMFDITADEETVTIHTLGYGHRVGMSQYGADFMARNGADFREILSYYYQGTQVQARQ